MSNGDGCDDNHLAGISSKHRRVVRGGAFSYDAYDARVAYRNNDNQPDNRNNNIGFRVVVSTF